MTDADTFLHRQMTERSTRHRAKVHVRNDNDPNRCRELAPSKLQDYTARLTWWLEAGYDVHPARDCPNDQKGQQ